MQYKQIKYKDEDFTIERNEDTLNVPHMFSKKYDFIKKACSNKTINDVFEKILILNIENLFYDLNVEDVDKDILLLNDGYYKMKSDLHLKFKHDYDYLEDEMTVLNNTI